MTSKGYYVVFSGIQPGIYETWDECQEQVHRYPGAKYRKYTTREEAEDAYRDGPGDYYQQRSDDSNSRGFGLNFGFEQEAPGRPIETAMCVHVKLKKSLIEYVYDWNFALGKKDLKRYTTDRTVSGMSQDLAEFDALVYGLMYLSRMNMPYPIYTESDTAKQYVENFRAALFLNQRDLWIVQNNSAIQTQIKKKVNWLTYNRNHNEVKKWYTQYWEPSPAASNKGYTL